MFANQLESGGPSDREKKGNRLNKWLFKGLLYGRWDVLHLR